jgi:hypothetical protein
MDDSPGRGSARDALGRFGPGNPGRPRGARGRMSRQIALGLLRHYAEHEAEILARLNCGHFGVYMRLIGRMLPEGAQDEEAAPDLEALAPEDAARVTRAVRAALERVEAGAGSLAEVQAALETMGWSGEAP